MTNEDKLEFIKANYKTGRCLELLSEDDKEIFLEQWVNKVVSIIPKNLYKYRVCNDCNLDSLRNKKAWFSNPSAWNDPIDMTVKYNIEKDIRLLKDNFDYFVLKFAFSFINKYIESFCEQKKFVTADKVKEVYYSAFKGDESFNPDRMINYLTPVVGDKPAKQITVKTQEALNMVLSPKFKDKIIGNLEKFLGFNDIKNKCIVYCLSETYTNNHQWAMYADGGKGFCVCYELMPKNKREASLLTSLLPIYYGEKKELLLTKMLDETLEYSIRPETFEDLVNQESEYLFISLYTKNAEWSGEQEWRISIPLEEAKNNLIDFDFAKIIYLGDKIEEEWKMKLIDIAKEQNIKVYQRKLDKMKSNWIYEEVLF